MTPNILRNHERANVRFCLAEFRGCPGRKANVRIRVANSPFEGRVYNLEWGKSGAQTIDRTRVDLILKTAQN